jgi:hypothetical protein
MAESNHPGDEHPATQVTQGAAPSIETVRQALARLRQLAAGLPQVDAVALVRETREGEPRSR